MKAPLLVSEQQYLTATYQPDCEYDGGELQKRNLGERPHSILQLEFGAYFRDLRKRRPVMRPFVEQRICIAPQKYRIPEVCVYMEPAPREDIFNTIDE